MKIAYIKTGIYNIKIKLFDTFTAQVIYSKLPIVSKINFWGNEVYFFTDLKIKLENNARHIVRKGELAYWPEGDAIAIGYGPTPISKGNEIRLASDCNIWGETEFDIGKLNNLESNEEIAMTQ